MLCLILSACSTTRHAGTSSHESEYHNTQRLDSLFKAAFQRDSIYVRDSIYLREKGDTIYHYVEKLKYQYIERRDTITRELLVMDTVIVERTDTITLVRDVVTERPVKWYNQGFIWLGRLCCIAALIWALFLYLKRKF